MEVWEIGLGRISSKIWKDWWGSITIYKAIEWKKYKKVQKGREVKETTSFSELSVVFYIPLLKNPIFIKNREQKTLYYITLTLFSVGLTNSYSKITNKYQLTQKI